MCGVGGFAFRDVADGGGVGLADSGRLGPGVHVAGFGGPGQEAFQVRASEGPAAVAARHASGDDAGSKHAGPPWRAATRSWSLPCSAAVFSAEPQRLVPVFAGADICHEAGPCPPAGSC